MFCYFKNKNNVISLNSRANTVYVIKFRQDEFYVKINFDYVYIDYFYIGSV